MKRMVFCALVGLPCVSVAADWTGEAELGVTVNNGNTESTDFNGRLSGQHEVERWRNQAELRSRYAKANDETTAERYTAEAETNYKFDDHQFWFLRGHYNDDRFSGYDFQTNLTTGYGNRLWQRGDRSFFELKVGAGYQYDRLDVPNPKGEDVEKGSIGRVAANLNYALSDSALFIQQLSSETSFKGFGTRTESFTAVQANVVGSLSMKASYRVEHESQVPAGSKNTDTVAALTLLYGF